MSKVNVVIIPDAGDPELVKSYFTNPLFNIIPTPVPSLDADEAGLIKTILQQASLENGYTLIIKDSSQSELSADQIADYVNQALVIPVDLYYLARWDDQCQLSKVVKDNPVFLRTLAPHGFQAILFYPSSYSKIINVLNTDTIEKVLYTLIYTGVITAICNAQNIFYYNAFRYGTSNILFSRLNTCSMSPLPNNVSETNKYLYIGGILILIFLVAWGMRKIGPKTKPSEDKRSDDLVKSLTKIED